MKICIIPARGGSKRIPKKNIKEFIGKPIIEYSINAAIKSRIFDYILVSTDDFEIAELSKSMGVEVPFIRPNNISDDVTGIKDVVCHAIKYLEEKGNVINKICCLLATAPLVEIDDIKAGEILLDKVDKDKFTFAATKFNFPIQRGFSINNNLAVPFDKYSTNKRSQDLEEFFHDAGQFYWGKKEAWFSKKNFFENSMPIILPSWRVQDVDTIDDWKRAELIFNSIKR
tara:strand:+ start:408 stop:1091 length:684 start_codon:yes stop_codon:yes gene_type:complete